MTTSATAVRKAMTSAKIRPPVRSPTQRGSERERGSQAESHVEDAREPRVPVPVRLRIGQHPAGTDRLRGVHRADHVSEDRDHDRGDPQDPVAEPGQHGAGEGQRDEHDEIASGGAGPSARRDRSASDAQAPRSARHPECAASWKSGARGKMSGAPAARTIRERPSPLASTEWAETVRDIPQPDRLDRPVAVTRGPTRTGRPGGGTARARFP